MWWWKEERNKIEIRLKGGVKAKVQSVFVSEKLYD